jgi:hypothetical protein
MSRDSAVVLPAWERTALGVAAGAYVLAWIIGLRIGFSFPSPDASGKEWANYLQSHQSLVVLQEYLIHGIAAIALIIFAAAVYTILRGGGAVGALPAVAFGGAIAAASVSLNQATVGQVVASKAAPTGDVSLVTSLLGVDNQADTYKLLGLILLVVCASVALAGIQAVPRWVMWGGIVVGVLLLLGSWSSLINFALLGLALDLSLLGLLAWVGVIAYFLMRSKSVIGGA